MIYFGVEESQTTGFISTNLLKYMCMYVCLYAERFMYLLEHNIPIFGLLDNYLS